MYSSPTRTKSVISVFQWFVAIMGVTGNLMVIYLFSNDADLIKMRKTVKIHVFIITLAVVDTLTSLFIVWNNLVYSVIPIGSKLGIFPF